MKGWNVYLNAIRYRVNQESEPTTWRFHHGSGTLHNVICVGHDRPHLIAIQSALVYALTGRGDNKTAEAALHLSDAAGDAWIIERTAQRTRYMRNGKPLTDEQSQQSLLNAILDSDIVSVENSANISPIKCLEVRTEGENLMAATASDDRANRDRMQAINEELRSKLADDLTRVFGQKAFSNPKTVINLTRRIEPIAAQLTQLLRLRKDLTANFQGELPVDNKHIPLLKDQLALLDKLQQVAEPLLDPANAPAQVRDRISKIDSQIAELCRACGIKSAQELPETVPWPKLIEIRGRVAFYDKLTELSDKAASLSKDRVGKIFESYVDHLSELLESKSQITSELESCLSSLQLEMQIFEKSKETRVKKTLDAVGSFLRPELKSQQTSMEATHTGRLEKARMAVDFALAKLGELDSELGKSREQFAAHEASMHERHGKLRDEFSRLLEQWRGLAKANGLPENLELSGVMKLSIRHQQLIYLGHKREELTRQLEARRSQLQSVEELVYKWRTMTGSHKSDRINNEVILLAEAQGMLRYRNSKSEQLQKLLSDAEQSKVQHMLTIELDNRIRDAQEKWHEAFHALQIPTLSVSDRNWPTFFEKAHTIQALSEILHEARKPFTGAQIFSSAASDTPITLYLWKTDGLSNKHRIDVMQALETSPPTTLQLHLVSDTALAEMLQKLGAGRVELAPARQTGGAGTRVVASPQQNIATDAKPSERTLTTSENMKRATAQTNSNLAHTPMLSDKAKAVMQLLGGARRPGSR